MPEAHRAAVRTRAAAIGALVAGLIPRRLRYRRRGFGVGAAPAVSGTSIDATSVDGETVSLDLAEGGDQLLWFWAPW